MEELAVEGTHLYVAEDEVLRGSEAPFRAVYADEAGEHRYGWLCGACDSLDNAMDTMGRLQCNDCGNFRKPEEWDATSG